MKQEYFDSNETIKT